MSFWSQDFLGRCRHARLCFAITVAGSLVQLEIGGSPFSCFSLVLVCTGVLGELPEDLARTLHLYLIPYPHTKVSTQSACKRRHKHASASKDTCVQTFGRTCMHLGIAHACKHLDSKVVVLAL